VKQQAHKLALFDVLGFFCFSVFLHTIRTSVLDFSQKRNAASQNLVLLLHSQPQILVPVQDPPQLENQHRMSVDATRSLLEAFGQA